MHRKLKPPLLTAEGIIGIVASVVFIVLLLLSFRVAMAFGALITFTAAIISLIVLLRTHNAHFAVSVIGQLLACCLLLGIALWDINAYRDWFIGIAGLMVLFMTLMVIFSLQRKMKWRTREMLELAALPVNETGNGLTTRPMQAGRMDYSTEELRSFTSFIRKRLIAIPVKEQNRIIFVINIPMGRLLAFGGKYQDRTWVAFDYEGNVTVNISQMDYFMYKDSLSFDKLCQSLGECFIGFMEQSRKGEESRIIEQLDSLKMNIITEG